MTKKINKKVKQELLNLLGSGVINGFANTEFVPTKDGDISEDRPSYIKSESEMVYNKANAHIILGRDRMGGIKNGFGGIGTPNSNAIDIVVGLGSSFENDDKKGEFLTPIDYLNKNPTHDAARLYISQRTDLDKHFEESMGHQYHDTKNKGVSGIALKADTVLLQGRRNVKIKAYPSSPFEKDAHGAELSNCRIELIAGANLEPVVKGQKLIKSMRKIHTQLSSNRAAIIELTCEITKLRAELMLHTHLTNTGVALPSAALLSASAVAVPKNIEKVINQLNEEVQMNIDVINSLFYPNEDEYILSNRVFTS
jgi:hypothetical protein